MSVDSQVLGVSSVAGVTAGTLVDTGNPIIFGTAAAVAMLVILGIVTRIANRTNRKDV